MKRETLLKKLEESGRVTISPEAFDRMSTGSVTSLIAMAHELGLLVSVLASDGVGNGEEGPRVEPVF